jgi:hypothetical protein
MTRRVDPDEIFQPATRGIVPSRDAWQRPGFWESALANPLDHVTRIIDSARDALPEKGVINVDLDIGTGRNPTATLLIILTRGRSSGRHSEQIIPLTITPDHCQSFGECFHAACPGNAESIAAPARLTHAILSFFAPIAH